MRSGRRVAGGRGRGEDVNRGDVRGEGDVQILLLPVPAAKSGLPTATMPMSLVQIIRQLTLSIAAGAEVVPSASRHPRRPPPASS